jgi:hypothetical protein
MMPTVTQCISGFMGTKPANTGGRDDLMTTMPGRKKVNFDKVRASLSQVLERLRSVETRAMRIRAGVDSPALMENAFPVRLGGL